MMQLYGPEQAVEAAKSISHDIELRSEQAVGDCEAASQSAHSRSKRGQDNGEGLSAKCIATAHRAFWSDYGRFLLGGMGTLQTRGLPQGRFIVTFPYDRSAI